MILNGRVHPGGGRDQPAAAKYLYLSSLLRRHATHIQIGWPGRRNRRGFRRETFLVNDHLRCFDLPVLDRNVKVDSNEYALSGDVDVFDSLLIHRSLTLNLSKLSDKTPSFGF